MKLNQFIKPSINAPRSINLERDYLSPELLDGYQITAKTLEILNRFADSLEGEKVTAWSLTGPYGMGKSAFVNFLMTVSGPASEEITIAAREKIKATNSGFYSRLFDVMENRYGEDGFVRIPITASYEPLANSLTRGLLETINKLKFYNKQKIKISLQNLLDAKFVEPSELFNLFELFKKIIKRPIILVVDEFGKNLDYMSNHPEHGDIFILQQLAEMDHVFLWVCLHQAFDGYASGLSTLQKQEWSKVQGRFEDVSFVETTNQMLYLMRKSLEQNYSQELNIAVTNWAKKIASWLNKSNSLGFADFSLDRIKELYPIHPITAIALIELSTTFGQNDRTLLSFMNNNELSSLRAFLEISEINDLNRLPIVGLDYLYDYFFKMSTTAYINRIETQRWFEIHDIINNKSDVSKLEQTILKTIGVLNLLSGSAGLSPNEELVLSILNQTTHTPLVEIRDALNNLVENNVILYRRYADEYRLWEGSDFNIEQAIVNKREKLEVGNLEDILQNFLPLRPIVAARHSYRTGTIRRFEKRWIDEEELTDSLVPAEGYDGLLAYCFGTSKSMSKVPVRCSDGRPLVIAYVANRVRLKELALEVAATQSVLHESNELKHDSIARKEVKLRIDAANETFRLYLDRLYSPGSDDVIWYKEGKLVEINSFKGLSSLISDLSDSCYKHCPPVNNEMVSYEKISSATSRARRVLVEAMVASENQKNLGLKGFGPEVAIYRSMLLSEGLHVKDETKDSWKFSLKTTKDYKELWLLIDQELHDNPEGTSAEKLIEKMKNPPFGLREGPAPIFLILYLIVNSDTVAVFQEGTYKPILSEADAALLLKRPDLFVFKKYVFDSTEQTVFKIYQDLLRTADVKEMPGLRNKNLVGTVGPLISLIESLPEYTKNTKNISLEAKKVRFEVQNSTDPTKLIFADLPKAIGMDVFDLNFPNKLHEILNELTEAFNRLYSTVQNVVLSIFKEPKLELMAKNQSERVAPLLELCDNPEIIGLIKAMNRKVDNPKDWVTGIAGIVIGKPLESWDDRDKAVFEAKLSDYADRLEDLEKLSSQTNKHLRDNAIVVSITAPNGNTERLVISANQKDVNSKIKKIIDDPIEARAILQALAEKLLGGR